MKGYSWGTASGADDQFSGRDQDESTQKSGVESLAY